MDMVNDGKDIRLDTPQAVKEALASGKDLYNTETGEFWWLYNATDSIATATIHLDDPNLLAVIDNPDFDLYEDIVGGLMRRPGTGVTAPTTTPSRARRRTLRDAPSPPPVWRSSAPTSGTAMTSNPPLRKPVSK